jgi:hypothetical protein
VAHLNVLLKQAMQLVMQLQEELVSGMAYDDEWLQDASFVSKQNALQEARRRLQWHTPAACIRHFRLAV